MTQKQKKKKKKQPGVANRVQAGRERTYHVDGMHCPACEILIEKKLIEMDSVHSVEVSTGKSRATVEYTGQRPGVTQLNKLFKQEGYSFALNPPAKTANARSASFAKIMLFVIIAVALIVVLQKAGLSRLVTVNSKSSLPVFLLLGLVAGFSTCAALVGGVVLSMSKQWGELHTPDEPLKKRFEPHLLFNSGRLISFALLGALLALIGGSLKLTPSISAILVIAISLIMVVLALQMLGLKSLKRFQFTMPRSVTRFVADETKFKGRYMPFTMGALTFFLPCGFAITAQSFALLSGKPLQGALIMLFFALGTLPMLILIGFSSVKFLEKPKLASNFLKVAGVLVLFFAIFNINNQLVVLNAPSLGDVFSPSAATTGANNAEQLPAIVGGKQILKMEASASGYNPSNLTVRVGTPVRWEIKDTGTSGCTNAIISRDLFSDQIQLTPGKTSTKEFTPAKTGRYKFSCWMGMVSGTISVVQQSGKQDPSSSSPAPNAGGNAGQVPPGPSGASAGLPPVVAGKQVLKMKASSSGYNPNHMKVLVGVPVRWEITDQGASGCTSGVKTLTLFSGTIQLKDGQTSVREFTPGRVGRFRFSCWMGMVNGVIDVVDARNPNQTKFDYDESTFPSAGSCCG